jgi:hypothetical protein
MKIGRTFAIFAGLAASAVSFETATLAQAPSSAPTTGADAADSSESIVVTGDRLTPAQARQRAVAFIAATGVAAGDTPVARWVDPVCPKAVGLAERHAAIVERRMRRIAGEAGIRVAPEDCQGNIEIRFTEDSDEVLRQFQTRAPRRLAQVTGASRERLLADPQPIRWWYSTGLRTRHGMSSQSSGPNWINICGSATGAGSGMPSGVPSVYHYNSSMVSTQAVRALVDAVVVIDVGRIDRMPLESIAAYAAMVAFAEIRESDFAATGSILGLFGDSTSAPRGLTEWDMAFLRVLYRLPLDRDARRHRGILVRDLLAAVEAGG